MWGKRIKEQEIDFEWPTRAIFEQMQLEDVQLASLDFKYAKIPAISSI